MARIVIKLAPGEKVPAVGDSFAGGTVVVSFPHEPWIVIDRDKYSYSALEEDPRVLEHRPEQTVKALGEVVHPEAHVDIAVGDTFPMIGVTPDVLKSANWGSGVVIAVVDTGVDNRHQAFAGKNVFGDFGDQVGHATHVASTAASNWGIASDASIFSKRVLSGPNGEGTESEVALGLQAVADWAVTNKANVVVNLSLGGSASSVIDAGVRYCQQRGLWVVAAAGNSGPNDTIGSPAEAADFVVGAVDRNSQVASFSSGDGTWQQISCFMPGVNIAAAAFNTSNGVAVMSGTSMATPHLTGVLALLRQAGMSLTDARNYVYAHETNLGLQNRKGVFVIQNDFGGGTPTPTPTPPDDQSQTIVDDATEVQRIVTEAQNNGWSDPQTQSNLGACSDYQDQIMTAVESTPLSFDDQTLVKDYATEVQRIIADAQQTGWSDPDTQSELGSIKNYMDYIIALVENPAPSPTPTPTPTPVQRTIGPGQSAVLSTGRNQVRVSTPSTQSTGLWTALVFAGTGFQGATLGAIPADFAGNQLNNYAPDFVGNLFTQGNVIFMEVAYRGGPVQGQLDDALAAFDLAAGHAAEWGGDPDKICLCGHSSGGWLAARVAEERENVRFAAVMSGAGLKINGYNWPGLTQQLFASAGVSEANSPYTMLPQAKGKMVLAMVVAQQDEQIDPRSELDFGSAAQGAGHTVVVQQVPGNHAASIPPGVSWTIQICQNN